MAFLSQGQTYKIGLSAVENTVTSRVWWCLPLVLSPRRQNLSLRTACSTEQVPDMQRNTLSKTKTKTERKRKNTSLYSLLIINYQIKWDFFVYEFSIRKKMISFDLIALVIIFLRQGFIAQAGLEVSVLFEPPECQDMVYAPPCLIRIGIFHDRSLPFR